MLYSVAKKTIERKLIWLYLKNEHQKRNEIHEKLIGNVKAIMQHKNLYH